MSSERVVGIVKGEDWGAIEDVGGSGGRESGTGRVGRGLLLRGSTDLRNEVKTSGRSLILSNGRSRLWMIARREHKTSGLKRQ